MKNLRVVVGGFLGILPAGGVTWDYVQYPLGFAGLGHDVYYLEDTRLYPIYQPAGSRWDDASSCVQHLRSVMDYFGLPDRWAYRDEASGKWFGLSESRVREICRTADVFVNVSCSTVMRDAYRGIPVRILIDSDPMFTQIQLATGQSFTPGGAAQLRHLVEQHNYHFTFGENIGAPDCRIPQNEIRWRPTRQPVCMEHWKSMPPPDGEVGFTTLMNWSAGKKLQYEGEEWGQKDVEFSKITDLPRYFPEQAFAIVVNQTGGAEGALPRTTIEANGWTILDPREAAGDWIDYRQFIGRSLCEFSVAKETYVKGRTGWFSCRSACYLAAGRPVIAQDTGWSAYYPQGEGLFAFHDRESARQAVEALLKNPRAHAAAARAIAAVYFDSRTVLSDLLHQIT